VVLKWFYSLSRRITFVGGKCTLPSALLVSTVIFNRKDLKLLAIANLLGN